MPTPRRRTHDDQDLPELPPLDGDERDEADGPEALAEELPDESPVGLDDEAADDLADDALDLPEDLDGDDEGDGPARDSDDDRDLDLDERERWTGDDAPLADDDSDLDDGSPDVDDDRGADGPEGEADESLEELPPLDDDVDGDRTEGDDAQGLTDFGAFALPLEQGARARLLVAGVGALQATVSTAFGVDVGQDRLYAVGDALVMLPLRAIDDPSERFEAVAEVDVDELFSSVVEDVTGALWLGAMSGSVWRRTRDGWHRVTELSDGRSTGAVELSRDGARLWAHTALGSLHCCEDGRRFESTLVDEGVRALAVDVHGGVIAALAGRRVDALRVSRDGGRSWLRRDLPEALAVGAVACAGDRVAVAQAQGHGDGYVSLDGGGSWRAWPVLAGASALCVVEADDGDGRVFFTTWDDASDRAVLATARIGADGAPERACTLVDLESVLPRSDHDDDEGSHRVLRVVPVDRAGRRLCLVTARGAVVLVSVRG